MNTSQVEQEVMEALKNNEFLPQVTFETFLKKKMNQRLAQARNKITAVRKIGGIGGRLNASMGKQGSLQAHNHATFSSINSTHSRPRISRINDRSDKSDSRMSGRGSRSSSAKNHLRQASIGGGS